MIFIKCKKVKVWKAQKKSSKTYENYIFQFIIKSEHLISAKTLVTIIFFLLKMEPGETRQNLHSLCFKVNNNFKKWRTSVERGGRPATSFFSSEPHSPHFFLRATSESSSFDYFVLKSFQFLKIKLFF